MSFLPGEIRARHDAPRLGRDARGRTLPDQPVETIKLDENSEFGTILRAQSASAYRVRHDQHIAVSWFLSQPHAVPPALQRITEGERL